MAGWGVGSGVWVGSSISWLPTTNGSASAGGLALAKNAFQNSLVRLAGGSRFTHSGSNLMSLLTCRIKLSRETVGLHWRSPSKPRQKTPCG